jgi:hypothetical protein
MRPRDDTNNEALGRAGFGYDSYGMRIFYVICVTLYLTRVSA